MIASCRPLLVAGLASIPSRSESLQVVLGSILPQVDCIELVLNDYDRRPDWLVSDQVKVSMSQDVGNHADNAKFHGLSKYDDCIYLTIDDDIVYPPDYVARMSSLLNTYRSMVAVGVHGSILPRHPRGLLDRKVCCFWNQLSFHLPCSYVGTGTLAFRRGMMPDDPMSLFASVGMSDLYVASWFKRQCIPVVAIARQPNWLQKIESSCQPSLWQLAQSDHRMQDELISQSMPWGIADIVSRCQSIDLESFSSSVVKALVMCGQAELNLESSIALAEQMADIEPGLRSLIALYLPKEKCR